MIRNNNEVCLFPQPAPAPIEQLVEVAVDVAKTKDATEVSVAPIAEDLVVMDDAKPEDLVSSKY